MSVNFDSDLDGRIASALAERARSLPSASSLPPMSPRPERPTRAATRTMAMVLVTLLVIGAAGVFVAVRRSGGTQGSVESGGSGAVRFRSTVIVRIAPESSAATPVLTLTRPLTLALSPGIRKVVLKKSQLAATDRPRVAFAASENAKRTLLTLVASAPTGAVATSVARNWANTFVAAVRANQRKLTVVQGREADLQMTALNRQLATIDTELARLDPAIYRNVLQYDEPTGTSPNDGGSATSVKGPPPVPERGTPHELNLAFERIQLLSARSKAQSKRAGLRFDAMKPIVVQVVSMTPATRIAGPK